LKESLWPGRLYRSGLLFRGPFFWHWRYYAWDYRAQKRASSWTLRLFGQHYELPALAQWQPQAHELHVVLSGPSIGSLREPARLTLRPVIAVNGSWRILAEQGHRAALYVISDVGYLRRQWETFLAGLAVSEALACDHRILLEIARRDASLLRKHRIYLFDDLQRPYRQSRRWWKRFGPQRLSYDADHSVAFSLDADIGFHPSKTVAYLALQIAASRQPRRIVLFGLDLSDGKRYFKEATPEKSMLQNDFAAAILPHFTFAAGVLRERGIETLNASPDSSLPESVFRRIDPNAYLETLSEQGNGSV
jgi:Kdo-III transferase WaaZ